MLKAKPESSVSLSSPKFMDQYATEEEQQQTPRSPFWIQPNNLNRLQRLSSLFFNSFALIIFLLLFALLSLLFIIPSLINISSNIFKPNLVKRSWDSINLILVLTALLFGFLTRNINNNNNNNNNDDDEKLNLDNDFQHQSINSSVGLRRQRTSISYPDLRELSPPWNHRSATDPWRFSDDTYLNYYNILDSNHNTFRQRSRREYNPQHAENSNLYTLSPEIEDLSLAPQQPPSQPESKQKTKKVYRNVATESSEKKKKRRDRSSEAKRILLPVKDPYPDPILLPPVSSFNNNNNNNNNNNKKKKRRQRERSVDNLNAMLHDSKPLAVKKFISVTLPPPTPPPPPPPRATITRVAPFITDKPRAMMACFNGVEDSSSGGESPMKNIPPPPPLPPFKMPDWKFTVEGDFVRLQGGLSSRSVSPDGDGARSPSSDVDTTMTTEMTLFCPSPDVDMKADSFIARFRAGLKHERMSKLGPGPNDI